MLIKVSLMYAFEDEIVKTELRSWDVQSRSCTALQRLVNDDLGHALRRTARAMVTERLKPGQRFDGASVSITVEPIRGVPLEDLFLVLAMEQDTPALMDSYVSPSHDHGGTPNTLRAIIAKHGSRTITGTVKRAKKENEVEK